MKKLFLIPLMAMFCAVMAWSAVRSASTFQELQDAIAAADPGDEIQLTADIAYPANGSVLNVTKNLTIDGQGHTLSGYGIRNSNAYPTIGVNVNNTANETELTLKNITIENDCHSQAYRCRPIETRGHVKSITLENVIINAPYGDESNAQVITIGGDDRGWCSETKMTEINMTNTKIYAGKSSYCITSFNPYKLDAKNCEFHGWCVADLAMPSGSFGSRYSVLTLDACLINTYNKHNTETNAYAAFSLRDDAITINLNGCTMNATELGSQAQCILMLNNFAPKDRRENPVVLNITGDNSNLSDALLSNGWTSGYYENTYYGESVMPETFSLTVNISGGTYPFNPSEIGWFKNGLLDGEDKYAESNIGRVTIPDGYEVSEVQQGDITLYRVVKKAAAYVDPVTEEVTLYDLNDNVEDEGKGENPVTSFDLSTGETMELDEEREVTTAGYVQVKDNEDTGNATVVKVGTTDGEENKVDQTLVINNGLDVQGDSKVEVQAGSALVIGEGGINTEKPENIVIEADENGAATLLLDPTITVNQTPELTVKMMAKQVGYKPKTSDPSKNDYYWHRFAMPVDQITALPRTPEVGTSIKFWDYTIGAEGAWADIPALTAMTPFNGYTLCPASAPQDVEYTFKGKLVGNTNNPLNFSTRGFNFFGNSYTGYISLLQLVDMITGDAKLEGSVWVWTPYQTYEGISLTTLRDNPIFYDEDWMKEVAPMQTFVLLVKSDDMPDMEINYASAIWGNPRYDAILRPDATPTPRRAASTTPAMRIEISAANDKTDAVMFFESENLSDAFDNGHDVSKYMNEGSINAYSTIDRDNFSTVATNNLEGKTISLNTNDEIAYTLLFKRVIGEDYALEDMATGKVIAIKEGTTYEFAAQPNSTVADRFRIVGAHKVPTSVETTEAQNVAKGIYTILGQYVGEDFSSLPAGVYVVDGVKIIK